MVCTAPHCTTRIASSLITTAGVYEPKPGVPQVVIIVQHHTPSDTRYSFRLLSNMGRKKLALGAKRGKTKQNFPPWLTVVAVAGLAVVLYLFVGGDGDTTGATRGEPDGSISAQDVGIGGGKYYGGQCPRSKYYFLYDVGPGERFNMRKAIVARPVATVKALSKLLDGDAVTLVLPPFKQFGETMFERWDRFFDVDGMASMGVQFCEQDQYWNSVKAKIDFVYLPSECPEEAMARRDFEQEVFGANVQIGRLFCAGESSGAGSNTDSTDPKYLAALKEQLQGGTFDAPKAVMVPGMEGITPSIDEGNANRLLVQQHMRFGSGIKTAANAWARSSPLGGRKYVSMHLRRGDFARAHASHAPSVTDVVTAVRDAARGTGVKDFVLATNGSPEEVSEIKGLLESDAEYPVALHRFGSAYENADVSQRKYDRSGANGEHSSLQVAAIEQALAAAGEVFFGTHQSTFSMQIHHERRAAGYDWDKSSRTVLPGPKLAKICVYGDRDAGKAKATKFVAESVTYDNEYETCEYW